MTLQDLLKTKVTIGNNENCTPDFRIAVQGNGPGGSTHVIVHAMDHNSETLDLFVTGNKITPQVSRPPDPPKCTHGKTMHEECAPCGRGRVVA